MIGKQTACECMGQCLPCQSAPQSHSVAILPSSDHKLPLLRVIPEPDGRLLLTGWNGAAKKLFAPDIEMLADISSHFEMMHDNRTVCERLLELKRMPKPPKKPMWIGTSRVLTAKQGIWVVQHHAYCLNGDIFFVMQDHTIVQLYWSFVDGDLLMHWNMSFQNVNQTWTPTIQRHLGYTQREWTQKPFSDFVQMGRFTPAMLAHQQALRPLGIQPFYAQLRHKNGASV